MLLMPAAPSAANSTLTVVGVTGSAVMQSAVWSNSTTPRTLIPTWMTVGDVLTVDVSVRDAYNNEVVRKFGRQEWLAVCPVVDHVS